MRSINFKMLLIVLGVSVFAIGQTSNQSGKPNSGQGDKGGLQGATGKPSETNDRRGGGVIANTGPTSHTGISGTTGWTGSSGATGATGHSGPSGSTGSTGSSGHPKK